MSKKIDLDITITDIAISDNYKIRKHQSAALPFLDYVSYEDDIFFYIKDIMVLTFNYRNKLLKDKGIDVDIQDIGDDILVEEVLAMHYMQKEQYDRGVEKDDPGVSFVYHDKRAKVKQAMKLVLYNDSFSEKAKYDYLLETYQHVEDCYDVLINLMEFIWKKRKDIVNKEVRKAILDKYGIDSDELIIYRGFNGRSREDGTSFTMSLDVAKFFAKRWSDFDDNYEGYVSKYKVDIDDVMGYLEYEEEIITKNAILVEENVWDVNDDE